LAVPSYQQMSRNLQALDLRVVRMRRPIERVAEELFDGATAELPGWQADRMNDQDLRPHADRPGVAVGGRNEAGLCDQTRKSVDIHARARPSSGERLA